MSDFIVVTAIGHWDSGTQIHKKKEEKEGRKTKKLHLLSLSLKSIEALK